MVKKSMIKALQWGGAHWEGPGGGTPTINYYFATEDEYVDEDTNWSTLEKQAFRAAAQSWADVAQIDFNEVFDADDATFIEHSVRGSFFDAPPGYVILGQHQTPGGGSPVHGVYNYQGIGWEEYDPNGGLQVGGFAYLTLVHEIGHGLGLAHPHDAGGGSGSWPGVSHSGDPGRNKINQDVNTVMSYVHGLKSKNVEWGPQEDNHGYVAGPMAFDIAAIQDLYGARASNTGDNYYELPSANMAGTYFTCLWDTGGEDTIFHDGGTDAVINLRAATLNASKAGGGMLSRVDDIYGGFTIANGVIIENASGGSGNDRIKGNHVGNLLEGNDGNDKLFGQKGRDRLEGGDGNDVLIGGKGRDQFVFDAFDGNDIIRDFRNTKDKIDLTGFGFADAFEALSHFFEWGSGRDNRLKFSFDGTEILVRGIDMRQLGENDLLV